MSSESTLRKLPSFMKRRSLPGRRTSLEGGRKDMHIVAPEKTTQDKMMDEELARVKAKLQACKAELREVKGFLTVRDADLSAKAGEVDELRRAIEEEKKATEEARGEAEELRAMKEAAEERAEMGEERSKEFLERVKRAEERAIQAEEMARQADGRDGSSEEQSDDTDRGEGMWTGELEANFEETIKSLVEYPEYRPVLKDFADCEGQERAARRWLRLVG